VYVSMDGFHYYRRELDAMSDPVEAHRRRGAPFTFNVEKFKALVQKLKEPNLVLAPSFDHSKKDPIEEDIRVEEHHRIVVVEGNYVLLDAQHWCDVANIFDSKWLVTVTRDSARKRVIARHVAAGIVANEEEGAVRADTNDLPNGDYALANLIKPDVVIESIDDYPIKLMGRAN
jgi:pantothenate kinase